MGPSLAPTKSDHFLGPKRWNGIFTGAVVWANGTVYARFQAKFMLIISRR